MPKILLADRPPIEAYPVIVDNWSSLDHEQFPGEYVHYSTFVIEALGHGMAQSRADKAMCLALDGLIQHLGLPILAPFEEAEGDEPWGPYGLHDYYIEAHGYARHANVIESYATEASGDTQTLTVLQHVAAWAREAVRHDTDRVPLKRLPGAFYTPQYPEKRIELGQVLSFIDFQDAARGAATSPAKAAAVFDKIVELLGDPEAKEHILQLARRNNATERKRIRDTSYIKTQALADFVAAYPGLPPEQQTFNLLALQVLRYVLYEEDSNPNTLVPTEASID